MTAPRVDACGRRFTAGAVPAGLHRKGSSIVPKKNRIAVAHRSGTVGEKEQIRIEAPGCIVHVAAGLADSAGRAVTLVSVSADGDKHKGQPQWWCPDLPDPTGIGVRVVEGIEKPKPARATEPRSEYRDCSSCGGRGYVPDDPERGLDNQGEWKSRECNDCRGEGVRQIAGAERPEAKPARAPVRLFTLDDFPGATRVTVHFKEAKPASAPGSPFPVEAKPRTYQTVVWFETPPDTETQRQLGMAGFKTWGSGGKEWLGPVWPVFEQGLAYLPKAGGGSKP